MKKSIVLLSLILTSAAFAAGVEVSTPCGKLSGRVFDINTGDSLGWTHLYLLELEAMVVSHQDGEYHFLQIPMGNYTVKATHIGYRSVTKQVYIDRCEEIFIDIGLSPSSIVLEEAEVLAARRDDIEEMGKPVLKKEGGKLQRDLGTTIAETISGETGISQRSMGPAPARPVLRGLSGDRLMVVEDGRKTGDLSATSADHAVAIEPLTAERVELIRGPESYIYTSGALGGIVNVKRNQIIRLKIHRVQGSYLSQYESVREGIGNALQLEIPTGPFAIRLDGSNRNTSDTETPSGTLQNTSIHTQNAGVGVSLPLSWGVIGVSGSLYESKYGIPGGFVGAHPNGVDIDMKRNSYRVTSSFYLPLSIARRLDFDYDYTRYYHAEYESSGAIGMEFGVVTHQLNTKIHLTGFGLDRSIVGVWLEEKDYKTGGFSNTPSSVEINRAIYTFHEKTVGNFLFTGALRFDGKDVIPDKQVYSVTIDTIKKRTFSGFSGAFSFEYMLDSKRTLGLNLAKSFKAPGIEELYSRGPHLAAYSFEIGNPELDVENGFGVDFFYSHKRENFSIKSSVFINRFEHFIFPEFTGYRSRTRTDLYEYRYNGRDAIMEGVELESEWQISSQWLLSGSMSYVQGDFGDDIAMPLIPPLSGNARIEWSYKRLRLGTNLKSAMAQNQLYKAADPDAISEERTAAWFAMDINMMYRYVFSGILHVLTFKIENLNDTSYRNHLSRIKSIVPEPGRNLRLVYKIYF